MPTTIHSNGSHFYGEKRDDLEPLFRALERYALDPTFENYGNFITQTSEPGVMRFWGNFAELSHVFNIDTDDAELIERLTAAIRANQQTPEYARAREAVEERRRYFAEIEAKKRREAAEKTLMAIEWARATLAA